jgi:hypothetical protein
VVKPALTDIIQAYLYNRLTEHDPSECHDVLVVEGALGIDSVAERRAREDLVVTTAKISLPSAVHPGNMAHMALAYCAMPLLVQSTKITCIVVGLFLDPCARARHE